MPRQPVLDWIKAVDPESLTINLSLESIRQEQNALLVPQLAEGQQEGEKWVKQRWAMLFEEFLNEWYTDESLWPRKRTFKMFKEWFEIQYHSMVWDMAAGDPVMYEDWDELSKEN